MRLRIVVVSVLTAAFVVAGATAPAPAAITWASPATAKIKPGVQTITTDGYGNGGQCTSNFVFSDGISVYLGQAAHCATKSGTTETNGCDTPSLPLGTKVQIQGARYPGVVAYSSWITMQRVGENDRDTCEYNDFALVRLDRRDHARVNPSLPFWGGPKGPTATTEFADRVFSYQNSSLRFGISDLKPKQGYSLGTIAGGWSHIIYTVTPGIPGDSGSAVINDKGAPVGVMVHGVITPTPASNGVTDLTKALSYMRTHGGPNATVVNGTVAFRDRGILP
jgi:hypothetical protein